MGHGIESDDTQFYGSSEPAWHKLGTVVAGLLTAQDALRTAQLDWDVELQPVYTLQRAPLEVSEAAFPIYGNHRFAEVDGKYAVVRTTDQKALGVVGGRYTPIQNREAFDFVDALVDSGDAKYDTAGSLAGGRRVFIVAKRPKDILVGGEESERIAKYLFFRNTHDGTSAVETLWTNIRVVCANTENAALRTARQSYRIRHTASWKAKLAEARKVLEISFAHDEAFEEMANSLISQPFTHGVELDSFLRKLIPMPAHAGSSDRTIENAKQRREDIKTLLLNEPNLQNVNRTKWGAFNAVTQWADWSRPVKGNGENRLNRILEDTGVKTRALELLTA